MSDLPDVVLVVLDTARADRFGCYGYPRPTTPTVDALAADGLRATTMTANAPWTLPSHASLFTGLYPSQHGSQWRTGPRLRERVPLTMAEWMRSLGYQTVCATNNGLISQRTRLARGFDRYAFRLDLERGLPRFTRRLKKGLVGGDSGGRIVNRWLRRTLRDVRGPLFLFVNYLECHWAYAPPPRMRRLVGGPSFRLLEGLRYRMRTADRLGPWEAIAQSDERTVDILSTLYDGEHRNADRHLAELLDLLARAGRLREGSALVIVTSDHGEHVGEHGLADHHASLDEHLLHVPFVAWGPGIIQRGTVDDLYESVDLLPSLARTLDRPLLAPHLEGRRTDLLTPDGGTGGYAFAEWRSWTDRELTRLVKRNPSYDFADLDRDLVSVRDRRFKLVRGSDDSERLYDLEGVGAEEVDVADQHPDVVRRLRDRLLEEQELWRAWEEEPEPLEDDARAEIERHLSALGYI